MRSQVVAILCAALSFVNYVAAAPAARYGSSPLEDACTLVTVYVTVPATTTVDAIQPTQTHVEYSVTVHTNTIPGSTKVQTVYLAGSTQTVHIGAATSSDIDATSSSEEITTTIYSKITLTKVRSTTTKTETVEVTYVYQTHKPSNVGTVYLTNHNTKTIVIGSVDSTSAVQGYGSTQDRSVVTVYETVTGPQLEPTYVIETITVIPLSTTPPHVPPKESHDRTSTTTVRITVMTVGTASALTTGVSYTPSELTSTPSALPYKPIEQLSAQSEAPCTNEGSSSVSSVTIDVPASSFNMEMTTSLSSPRFSSSLSTTIDSSTSESSLAVQSGSTIDFQPTSSVSLILLTGSVDFTSYGSAAGTSVLIAYSGFTAIPSSSSITTSRATNAVSSSSTRSSMQSHEIISATIVDGPSPSTSSSMPQTYPMMSSPGPHSDVLSPASKYAPPYPLTYSTSTHSEASSSAPRYPILYPTAGRDRVSSSTRKPLVPYPMANSTGTTGSDSSFMSSATSTPYPSIPSTSGTAGVSSSTDSSALQSSSMTLSTGVSSETSESVYKTNPPYVIASTSTSAGVSSSNNSSTMVSYNTVSSKGASSGVLSSSAPAVSTIFTMGHFTFTFPKLSSSTTANLTSSSSMIRGSIYEVISVSSIEEISSLSAHYEPTTTSFTMTSFGGYSFVIPSSTTTLSDTSEPSSLAGYIPVAESTIESPTSTSSFLSPSVTSKENMPTTTFSLIPHLTSTLTASSTATVAGTSSGSVNFSSYTFSTFTSSSNVETVTSTAAASSTVPSLSISTDSSSLSDSVSSVELTESTVTTPSNLAISTTANPTLSDSSTTVSATSSPSPSSCGPSGDFTLNFDDIPPLVAPDNTTSPEPIFSPYHKFWFVGGLVVVPPPTTLFVPSSGNLLLELLKNFTTSDSSSNEIGSTAEIGTGPDEGLACFGFNAISASIGCNSNDDDCDWQFTGLQYNPDTAMSVEVTTQYISTPACLLPSGCTLVPVTLDSTFQDLTSVRINVTVGGLPEIWWLDDLQLGWTDNSCDAAACRQNNH